MDFVEAGLLRINSSSVTVAQIIDAEARKFLGIQLNVCVFKTLIHILSPWAAKRTTIKLGVKLRIDQFFAIGNYLGKHVDLSIYGTAPAKRFG